MVQPISQKAFKHITCTALSFFKLGLGTPLSNMKDLKIFLPPACVSPAVAMLGWVSLGGNAAKGMERFTRCLGGTRRKNKAHESWRTWLTAFFDMPSRHKNNVNHPTPHLLFKRLSKQVIYSMHFTWITGSRESLGMAVWKLGTRPCNMHMDIRNVRRGWQHNACTEGKQIIYIYIGLKWWLGTYTNLNKILVWEHHFDHWTYMTCVTRNTSKQNIMTT